MADHCAGRHRTQGGREGAHRERGAFRLLVEQIHHLVWSARPDGHIAFYNRRTLQYFGASLEQLQGWSWCNFVHPEDVPATTDVWRQAFTTGSEARVQFRLRRHDGTFRWHLAHAFPFRHADGRILRWYGTYTDINDQKQTEDALREAVGELQNKQTQLVQAAKWRRSESWRPGLPMS